jgi:hypothetical protein
MNAHEMIEYAMDIMVEHHYHGFHQSIESFSSVLEKLFSEYLANQCSEFKFLGLYY